MSKSSIELQGYKPDSLADDISLKYTSWNNARQGWKSRVQETIKYVYATSTKETDNASNPWSHSTVIPKLTQIHDNLGANYTNALFANREFFTFEPATRDEASFGKRTAIINYLRTKHDYNGFRAVCKSLLDDWVRCGVCFARVEYVRDMETDPITGEEYVVYEGPKPIRISPWDIVFDPTVAEFKNSPKIFRELITRGELIRRSEGPEGKDYDTSALRKLRDFYGTLSGWSDSDINKHIQMQMDGFSTFADWFHSGQVELLTFVGDIYDAVTDTLHRNRLITIADRRVVLRNVSLQDYQGFGRIYMSGWRKRPDNLWAQGPLDNLVGMQYLINHLENARADGFDQILSPDRVIVGQVESRTHNGVTTYYIDDGNGSVSNLGPDPTILNADNQIALKEAQMEAYAGAPREAMGIRSPGEKTAFEVNTLATAASRLFQTKIEDFEQEVIEPLLNGELEVAVLNLNTTDVYKVLDEDFGVAQFLSITREDLQARGKLKARGASHYAKRAQRVQELQAFGNILAGDPSMSVHYPAKARAKAWNEVLGLDDLQLFQPFGAIAEQVELAEVQSAAQQMMAQHEAAVMSDTEAQEQAADAAAQLM